LECGGFHRFGIFFPVPRRERKNTKAARIAALQIENQPHSATSKAR
jgi:hypothetical protein